MVKNLSDDSKRTLMKNSPDIVIDKLQIVMEGDGFLEDKSRNISDLRDVTMGDNFNQGDNVSQTSIKQTPELREVLEQLKEEIKNIPSADKQEVAEMHYDLLEEYIEQNEPSKIKKSLIALNEILSTSGSIFTIADQFGISIS